MSAAAVEAKGRILGGAGMADTLADALAHYRRTWPGEIAKIAEFQALLDEPTERTGLAFTRARLEGHFTASAWLVSSDLQRVLLTHHRKLDRWLQLGGHADGDIQLARVALREAEEESGLTGLEGESQIFDLDRHWIPERAEEPGHWHFDVRYVVRATASEAYVVSAESHALAWRDIGGIAADADADPSLQRMARRWLERWRSE